ncbi:MAG: gamma-glutamylcyclotransferase [Planctomycetes bacterium]|nr:gamma-glutamylcyclotransferase [Planctomycetota bacterium]
MAIARTILFVYGTLRRGERNHRLLAGQEFIGEAVTAPRYRVFDLGPHPGLARDEQNGLAVHGELFAVGECCLAELDDFEEVPGPFVREPIEIDGYEQVWAYYMNTPVPEGAKSGHRWPLPPG